MDTLGPSPFLWLEFDKTGAIDPATTTSLAALLNQPGTTDLVVMSHGWKNTKDDARKLYGTLWANARKKLAPDKASHTVVAGVVWPAKAYRTDFDTQTLVTGGGGAQAAGGTPAPVKDLAEEDFKDVLADFEDLFGPDGTATAEKARAAAETLDETTSLFLVRRGNEAIGAPRSDTELKADAEPIALATEDANSAKVLMEGLVPPPTFNLESSVGEAQGLGDFVSGVISGPRAAVARFLNQLTYYEMKKRAGIVGEALTKNVLSKLVLQQPIRLHLVGHSFGARLVAAAANGLAPVPKLEFFSLTLLQGAFSHNGFAKEIKPGLAGAFPDVVGKPTGPICITHTHNDLACTLAYALASRLSRDIAKSIGDANDEFGAMGANGPQHLKAGQAVEDDTDAVFTPQAGKVNTFLADKYIIKTAASDAHNNVANEDVGRLLAKIVG
ncbi:hypothetical protein J3P71_30750 (plasmid) [Rhizobium leguminosarum]|uniref:hypothetical protein n=1 Tax=Rhizobium leguminosarum TaxID=384 RepID=UPI0014417F0A|nr:hypothetical protein [Rhizobium leguminosarum]MBY5835541.1 hypothetical protein [Rhizobium leguminosarum]NKM78178.1 hypothetical protein [Rhizobium leguminosarum bv. viciae]QSZ11617.1 hypothetical protein J3P71_30750 [Rhizobium leguminosarum]